MKLFKIFISVVIAVSAAFALADKPKPGIYSFTHKDLGTEFELTISTRGKNWQVEGHVPMSKKINGTFAGTLFGSNYKLKGTCKYKDASGKNKEVPVDGHWVSSNNTLEITIGMLQATFSRDANTTPAEATYSFTGTWNTSFGKMTLSQSGKKVTGDYDYHGGTVEGEIRGDGKLYLTWTQKDPDKKGKGVFTLNRNSFSGTWDYTLRDGSSSGGGGWSGTRIIK